MITYVQGNLFESPAQVLVNAVNTVGVMGKGIAKEFKHIYPEMFKQYQKYCEQGDFQIGKLMLYKTSNKWILNFPTKTTWRNPSKLEYIDLGLRKFRETYIQNEIKSIAFPPLGCGNGELNWESQVQPLMEKYLNKIPIDVFIHFYNPSTDLSPEHRSSAEIAKWLRREPEDLPFCEVWQDLQVIFASPKKMVSLLGTSFVAHLSQSELSEGLMLEHAGASVFVPQDIWAEIWNQIRSYGFCSKEVIMAGLEDYSDKILAVFACLPYCRQVNLGKSSKTFNRKENCGIQIFSFEPEPRCLTDFKKVEVFETA